MIGVEDDLIPPTNVLVEKMKSIDGERYMVDGIASIFQLGDDRNRI